jgi:Peptidase family M23
MGDRRQITDEPVARVSWGRTLPLAVLVTALITVAGMSASAQARTAPDRSPGVAAMDPGPTFTGLAASFLTHPQPVRGTDGRFHIAYELMLTDTTQFPLNVKRVEVRDGKTHRVLLSLDGHALSSRMNSVAGATTGMKPPDTTLLSPSGSAVVWLDVRVRRKADLPDVLQHRVVASTRPPPGEQSIRFSSRIGRVSLRARKPVELGPPVRGGIWVAAEGCCDFDTHHRRGLLVVNGNEVVSQRFAIDWIKVDRKHRAWVGDPARLSSYRNYGKPLIASARGKVMVARDQFPNQPPPNNPTPPSVPDLPGNVVVLRVGPGIYLTYAHMVPGSVRVHVGERVRRGQVLGRLGNSGNSATPHLHLQVQSTRGFLSDGLPFVFRSFRFLGKITEPVSDENLGLRPNGKLPFARASRPGPRHREMPLDLTVVRFP